MKPNTKRKVSLTAILIQDKDSGGFTSYFAEVPEAVAEGDSEMEAVQNLFDALDVVNEFRRSEAEENDDEYSDSVITKSFEFELQ